VAQSSNLISSIKNIHSSFINQLSIEAKDEIKKHATHDRETEIVWHVAVGPCSALNNAINWRIVPYCR